MPTRLNPISLRFPSGGVNEKLGYQSQPPFTAVRAANVRNEGVVEDRERGGSRPGLRKAFGQRPASTPVRLLTTMRLANTAEEAAFFEDWSGGLTDPPWKNIADDDGGTFAVSGGLGGTSTIGQAGVYQDNITIDYSGAATVTITLDDHPGNFLTFADGEYFAAVFKLDDTTPSFDNCLLVKYVPSNPAVAPPKVSIEHVSSGTPTEVEAAEINLPPSHTSFSVRLANDTITAFVNGNEIIERNVSAYAGGGGTNTGIAVDFSSAEYHIESVNLTYLPDSGNAPPEQAVVSAGGELYRETSTGTLSDVSVGNINLVDDSLTAVDRLESLYVADYLGTNRTRLATRTNNVYVNAGVLTHTGVDFTALGIDTDTDVCEVSVFPQAADGSDGSNNNTMSSGTFKLENLADGTIGLVGTTGSTSTAGTITYRISRGPKFLDPDDNWALFVGEDYTTYEASLLTGISAGYRKGAIPIRCKIVTLWRDRLVFAGDQDNAGLWYMSRQGNPADFDYSVPNTDTQRAVAGIFGDSDTAALGAPITAVIPLSDDYLVFGSSTELWLLRGDPAYEGLMDNLSREIGIVGPKAWCRLPDGRLMFMSHDGLYMLMPDGQSRPISVSREKLPRRLRENLNTSLFEVTMGYDVVGRGVHIYVTQKTQGTTSYYFYDVETESFWPVTLRSTQEVFDVTPYTPADPARQSLLVGCRDGYVREFHPSQVDDDGTDFTSYVDIGPIRLANSVLDEGLLERMIAVFGSKSGDVTWEVYTGNTAQEAYNQATPAATGTFTSDSNYTVRPRVRGNVFILRITSSGTSSWSMEEVACTRKQFGRFRKV